MFFDIGETPALPNPNLRTTLQILLGFGTVLWVYIESFKTVLQFQILLQFTRRTAGHGLFPRDDHVRKIVNAFNQHTTDPQAFCSFSTPCDFRVIHFVGIGRSIFGIILSDVGPTLYTEHCH